MSNARVGAIALSVAALFIAVTAATRTVYTQQNQTQPSSYIPVHITESFASIRQRMTAAKPAIVQRQMDLLNARYDLSNRPAAGVTMSRGKAVQEGVRVKLPQGVTWDQLTSATPDEIKRRAIFPAGFMPLPHPNQPEGGMLFPKFLIDEIKRQLQAEMGLLPVSLIRDRRSSFVELYSYDQAGEKSYGTAGYLGNGYFITVKHGVMALSDDLDRADSRRIVSIEIIYKGKKIKAQEAGAEELARMPGTALVGRPYAPLLPFFAHHREGPDGRRVAFRVVAADYVTVDLGMIRRFFAGGLVFASVRLPGFCIFQLLGLEVKSTVD